MSKRTARSYVVLAVAVACAIGTLAVVIAQSGEDAPTSGENSGPDAALKATESARPTPTTIPSTSSCPVSSEACAFAQEVSLAIARGGSALLDHARFTTVQCTDENRPGTQPLCGSGGQQIGYLTATHTSYGLVAEGQFLEFLAASLGGNTGTAHLVSIGCPRDSDGQADCTGLLLITVATDGAAIVAVATADESGDYAVVALQRSSMTEPAVRGGQAQFAQMNVDYQGPVWFYPVSLP